MNTFMRRFALLLVLAVTTLLTTRAEVPTGYYSSVYGKSGQALKDALHQLLKRHTVVTYGSLWYHFPYTDHRFDNPSVVWDMYSNTTRYFRGVGSSVSGMNREHSLPKSWWGGDVVVLKGTSNPVTPDAYTDLHHLYPSDATANTAKLNYPFGEVSKVDFDNHCCRTGSPVAGQGGGSSVVFEPNDEYKGDFARTFFYMATCYQNYTWKYTYMMSNTSALTLNPWCIDLLLRWARQDPVSDKEVARNEEVYKIQNNRNPFIDNPDLMEYIWGNKAGQVFNSDDPDLDDPDQTPRLITPTQGTQIQFGEVALGKSLTMVVYIKAKHLKNALSVTIYKDDASAFTSSVSSVPAAAAMSEEGYPLAVTYKPTALGNHTCRLLLSDGGIEGSLAAQISASCLPVPTLSALRALPASEVEDGGFTARWEPAGEDIDFYVVNRIVYDKNNSILSNDRVTTDETSYRFDDLKEGQTHTYTVQSSRLGYTSNASNVITVNATSGVEGIAADKPVAFLAMDGAVLVKCSEPLTDVRIYAMNGALVRHLPVLRNDDVIALPGGIYVFTAAGNVRPCKIVIK